MYSLILFYKSAGGTSRYQFFNIKARSDTGKKRRIPFVTVRYHYYLKNPNDTRVLAVSGDPDWNICI